MTSNFFASILRGRAAALASVAVAAFTLSAHADPIITNGSFDSPAPTSGWVNNGTTVSGWTATGYTFAFNASTAASGVPGDGGTVALYNVTASPNGGSFIAMNGAYKGPAIISQTVSGL